MLVEFKVGNFLSFKGEMTFSMIGHTIKEHDEQHTVLDPTKKNKLLKSSVLYGANGSGKSNFLSALRFVRHFILNSSNNRQIADEIEIMPFLFSKEMEEEPSSFEITFFIGKRRYRYGFEVDKKQVQAEWLFSLKHTSSKEARLFTREFQEIDTNKVSFKEGKGLENNTRPNALFLSTVAQLNGKIATQILSYFHSTIRIISGIDDDNYIGFTIEKLQKEPKFKTQLVEFFKSIKIGFEDIEVLEEDSIFDKLLNLPADMPAEVQEIIQDFQNIKQKMDNLQNASVEAKSVNIKFLHQKFNDTNEKLDFVAVDLGLQSKGTQKLFNLFGIWIDTIENDKILIIDELDARLHTLLTIELIKFFHSKANQKAQLIFASHDTSLLKKEIFRRDQIWFTEKDKQGATDLYSLVEYAINQTKIRNDASFEKNYLLGKYGAIPFLGDINNFIISYLYDKEEKS